MTMALPTQEARAADSTAPTVVASQSASGAIVGVVVTSGKAPVARATVTAVRAGGGTRATLSGSDGVYSFADLTPGAWSLTVQSDGNPDVAIPPLEVVASKATRYDVVVNGAATAANAAAGTPAAVIPTVPLALQAPPASSGVDNETPFAFGDFTWLNGTPP